MLNDHMRLGGYSHRALQGVPAVRIADHGKDAFDKRYAAVKGEVTKASPKGDSQYMGHNQMLQAISPGYFFQ